MWKIIKGKEGSKKGVSVIWVTSRNGSLILKRDRQAFHQGLFGAKVDKKLDGLGLNAGKRNRIEAEISRLVPRPTREWALWAVTCVPRHDS